MLVTAVSVLEQKMIICIFPFVLSLWPYSIFLFYCESSLRYLPVFVCEQLW